jgi:hypothetical protein
MGLCQAIPRPPPPTNCRLWVRRIPPELNRATHLLIDNQDVIGDMLDTIEARYGLSVTGIYRSTDDGRPDFNSELAVDVNAAESCVGNDGTHPLWYTVTGPRPPPNTPRRLWVRRIPPESNRANHLLIGDQDIIGDVLDKIEDRNPGLSVTGIYRSTDDGQPDYNSEIALDVNAAEFFVGNDETHPLWYTGTNPPNPIIDAIQRQSDAIQRQLTVLQRIEARVGRSSVSSLTSGSAAGAGSATGSSSDSEGSSSAPTSKII